MRPSETSEMFHVCLEECLGAGWVLRRLRIEDLNSKPGPDK